MSKVKKHHNHQAVIWFMACGLILMAGASLSYFTTHPSLTMHLPTKSMPTTASAPATQNEQADGISLLMQKLQTNPQDVEALLSLTEHYMHIPDWAKAEAFVLRAVMAQPESTKPMYLLGIIQHSQGRHQEAATSLQKVLQKDDDPSIRYSLAMLYAHYLQQVDTAKEQFQALISNEKTPPAIKEMAQTELAGLNQPKPQ